MKIYDPYAHSYDADFNTGLEDLPLYREMARRTGGPILELMCGTGRLLLPLAEDGYHLTGVDSSQPMLEVAHTSLSDAGFVDQATLLHGDVRTIELPTNHFALAFVAINSFMHLQRVNDQLAALRTAHTALAPDGLFIIDLFNPNPVHMLEEDNRLVLERHYVLNGRRVYKLFASDTDPASQTTRMTYFFDEVDEQGTISRRVMEFTMRWLYRYELEHLLARAGFVLQSLYGSYDLEPYTNHSERMIAVAALTP
jgi:SAM-dependent methyltransferase